MKTLIQIGSNVGQDSFQSVCEGLKEESKILLIEANELLIPHLKENYKDLEKIHHIEYLNIAITPFDNCEYIDLYYNPGQDGLSSLINRNTHRLLNTVKVSSKTVNKILEEKNIEYVDELHMDLEGLDYEILLSLDLEKYHFSLITCEVWPYTNDDLNESFRTGPVLMDEILNKFQDYNISEIFFSNSPTLKFVKN